MRLHTAHMCWGVGGDGFAPCSNSSCLTGLCADRSARLIAWTSLLSTLTFLFCRAFTLSTASHSPVLKHPFFSAPSAGIAQQYLRKCVCQQPGRTGNLWLSEKDKSINVWIESVYTLESLIRVLGECVWCLFLIILVKQSDIVVWFNW